MSNWCLKRLKQEINSKNVIEILNSIRKTITEDFELDLSDLENDCFLLIIEKGEEILNERNFLEVSKNDLIKILQENNLKCPEKLVFDR